jgi:hypothetical protein
MAHLLVLLLLFYGDFGQFLAQLKKSPPACVADFPFDFPVHRPAVWSEHYGPRLVSERVVQLAPGVAVVTGEVIEIGPPFGLVRRPVRILAVQKSGDWSIRSSECGPAPRPALITRLAQ